MNLSTESLITVRDFVRWGASRFHEAGLFFGHGTDNALDEAVLLVTHALHLPLELPPEFLDARLTPGEREQVSELLRRRIEDRLPAPYLTGRAWFAGLEFHVDANVLVPRSPFAELIENELRPWAGPERVGRLLDLCTGSGCIGIAAAVHLPDARVDLTDISPTALQLAGKNVREYDLEDRVRVLQSDLFDGLGGERYDVILSNPPYVGAEELAGLPAEYHREPVLGLAGGADGLDLVRRMLRDAGRHLNPGGVMIVEVGNSAKALTEVYPEVPFLWLEFERGGEGVFLLTREQLEEYRHTFEREVTDTP